MPAGTKKGAVRFGTKKDTVPPGTKKNTVPFGTKKHTKNPPPHGAKKRTAPPSTRKKAAPPAGTTKKTAPPSRTKKASAAQNNVAAGQSKKARSVTPRGAAKQAGTRQVRTKENAVERSRAPKNPKSTVRRDTQKGSVQRGTPKKAAAVRRPSTTAAPPRRKPKKVVLSSGARQKLVPLGRTRTSSTALASPRRVTAQAISLGEKRFNALLRKLGKKARSGTPAQKRAVIAQLKQFVVILKRQEAEAEQARAKESHGGDSRSGKTRASGCSIDEPPAADATQDDEQDASSLDLGGPRSKMHDQALPDQQRDTAAPSLTKQTPATGKPTAARRGRGRPLKLTAYKQEVFCDLIDAGLTRSRAAKMIGCVPSAISKALERDAAFRKRVRRTERIAEGMRLKKMHILAPRRHRRHVERLRDIFRGRLKVGPERRKFEHRLQIALLRLAALKLRRSLDA
ncbi:MAG TPA: hypothetical protein VGN12_18045 [Pirellulales bacterium]